MNVRQTTSACCMFMHLQAFQYPCSSEGSQYSDAFSEHTVVHCQDGARYSELPVARAAGRVYCKHRVLPDRPRRHPVPAADLQAARGPYAVQYGLAGTPLGPVWPPAQGPMTIYTHLAVVLPKVPACSAFRFRAAGSIKVSVRHKVFELRAASLYR